MAVFFSIKEGQKKRRKKDGYFQQPPVFFFFGLSFIENIDRWFIILFGT
jgi:hypothetical protein